MITELFREHHAKLLALCLHLTGNKADAEDALQEAFISAARAIDGFRGEAKLSTWIYRIAIREALRQKSRSRARSTELLDPAIGGDDPRKRFEQRDELQRALAQLGAEHRTVICLFAIDGLTHKEIAEILNLPEGTIWSRLHTARKKLAAALSLP